MNENADSVLRVDGSAGRAAAFFVIAMLALLPLAIGCGSSAASPDAAPEPRVVVENGAWTWFNDERAIIVGDDLIVGFVDTAGYSGVAVLPLTGEYAGEGDVRRLSTFRQSDDHNNPAFLQLSDDRLLAAYAQHHVEPYWYWRHAQRSGDTLAWSEEHRSDDAGAYATYSNLFQLEDEGGRIYNFFRGENFDPAYVVSEDGGETWSDPRHLILSGSSGRRPYVKYASNGQDRIDLLYTPAHPRQESNDIYHVFYRDGFLHTSDGNRIQPIDAPTPMVPEEGTLVYHAEEAGRGWVWDLEYDGDGSPVATYIAARDSTVGLDLRYRYARWNDEAPHWREQEIAFAGTHLYDPENHYAGGITIDPADTRRVYISADVDPATGDPTDHYQIYRGTTDDGGETWSWEQLTESDEADNIRPFVPRGDRHVVLWLRGEYTTYENYDTDIVALIEN